MKNNNNNRTKQSLNVRDCNSLSYWYLNEEQGKIHSNQHSFFSWLIFFFFFFVDVFMQGDSQFMKWMKQRRVNWTRAIAKNYNKHDFGYISLCVSIPKPAFLVVFCGSEWVIKSARLIWLTMPAPSASPRTW